MKKQELRQIIKEELQSVLKEVGMIQPPSSMWGHDGDYWGIKSDISDVWDSPKTIEKDLYKFLEASHDSGGPELLKDVLNAMVKAINKAKPLMNK